MPHVSKNKLDEDDIKRLEDELVRTLERGFKNNQTKQVLRELLTKTEKAMIAKRLGVIALLSKDFPITKISTGLKMSIMTVQVMQMKYERGLYKNIINDDLGKKDIWNILEHILSSPLATRKGLAKKFAKLDYDQKLIHS